MTWKELKDKISLMTKEEFDKVNKENQDPELESINSFNNTLKNANEIKDRVLKYVYNIKQERSYNNDLVGIFERYKDIADGDMEVAMNFIKGPIHSMKKQNRLSGKSLTCLCRTNQKSSN